MENLQNQQFWETVELANWTQFWKMRILLHLKEFGKLQKMAGVLENCKIIQQLITLYWPEAQPLKLYSVVIQSKQWLTVDHGLLMPVLSCLNLKTEKKLQNIQYLNQVWLFISLKMEWFNSEMDLIWKLLLKEAILWVNWELHLELILVNIL